MRNKNGIPVANSRRSKYNFNQYVKYATMMKMINGFIAVETVPVGHEDYKLLQRKGYKTIDVWEKGD